MCGSNMLVASLLIGLLATADAPGGVTFNPPSDAYFRPLVDCDHGTPGFTALKPLIWNSATDLAAGNFAQIVESNLTNQFPNTWHFVIDNSLDGVLNVNWYKAIDGPASCQHGAQMDMSLSIANDPTPGHGFAWLQLTSNNDETWLGDPPNAEQVAGGSRDSLPFYYDYEGFNSLGVMVGAQVFYEPLLQIYTFTDIPWDQVPDSPPHAGFASFWTLLTRWNEVPGATNTVSILGAVEWGYRYECVPTPSALAIMCVGSIISLRRRRA